MPYVTRTWLVVHGTNVRSDHATQNAQQVQERGAGPAGDVEGAPRGGTRRLARLQVGLHGVVHVGEVARLQAVTEHNGGPSRCGRLDEVRHDGRVLRVRILPRPEDIE